MTETTSTATTEAPELRNGDGASHDYRRVEAAIRYLDGNLEHQPNLAEVAEVVGLSEYHFQRLFKRWAGVSPKRFLQFLTVEHAKRMLRDSQDVLSTAYAAGLSSGSRLYDHFVAVEAVTPGEFKSMGRGLEVRFGFHPSPFGDCLVAATDRGICALEFLAGREPEGVAESLARRWPRARLEEDPGVTAPVARRAFGPADRTGREQPLTLALEGTNFQVQVWKALLSIPPGCAATYGAVAESIGRPSAARAVGAAAGRNRVAFLIPCHRVLRSLGGAGGYRWGVTRKRLMLAWESARTTGDAGPDRT